MNNVNYFWPERLEGESLVQYRARRAQGNLIGRNMGKPLQVAPFVPQVLPNGALSTPSKAMYWTGQHTTPGERRAKRFAVKRLGIRQYKRAQYAARDQMAVTDV